MHLKESICKILSDKKLKKGGLHVKHIAIHILNSHNTLFNDGNDIDFEEFKRKINQILASDVRKKKNSQFSKVLNSKTNKFKKGYYKLNPTRKTEASPVDFQVENDKF